MRIWLYCNIFFIFLHTAARVRVRPVGRYKQDWSWEILLVATDTVSATYEMRNIKFCYIILFYFKMRIRLDGNLKIKIYHCFASSSVATIHLTRFLTFLVKEPFKKWHAHEAEGWGIQECIVTLYACIE